MLILRKPSMGASFSSYFTPVRWTPVSAATLPNSSATSEYFVGSRWL